MLDGAVAELIRPPIAAENPPIEAPTSTPEMEMPPKSFTPLTTPGMENGADMEQTRQMVQNMIAQEDSKHSATAPKHEPEIKRKRKFVEFLGAHKFLAIMLSPLIFILTSLFKGFKGDGGGGSH